MSRIASVTFTLAPISSNDYENGKALKEEIKKWKNKICKVENVSMSDLHWVTSVTLDSQDCSTVTVAGFRIAAYKGKSTNELSDILAETQEELEELEEELEEIEDLDEEDYDDYAFGSEEEYKERLYELEKDIFIYETEIELVEEILEERTDSENK